MVILPYKVNFGITVFPAHNETSVRGNIRIDCRSGENRTPIRGFGDRYSTVKLRSQYVEPPGFEPGISEPKSDVLPLHHGSMCGPPGIEPGTSRGKASEPHYRLSNKRPKCPSFRAAIGFRVTCQMKSSVFSALPPHIQMRKSHTSSSSYLPNTQSKMWLRHRQGSNLHPFCALWIPPGNHADIASTNSATMSFVRLSGPPAFPGNYSMYLRA